MHKTRYNALHLTVRIRPKGPLLIKAGGISANPALPDMQFVRTFHPDRGETVYIPGSSLKGVVRGFVEKALRTFDARDSWRWACPTFPDEAESCARRVQNETDTASVYHQSCGACRIFGHTRLRGRLSFTDSFPVEEVRTEIRYGVAISRLTHAVAHGPFEMEVAVSGTFEGHLVLENFEIWQLGLVATALAAMNQGLVKVGFGKNRGFGEVEVEVQEAWVDEVVVNYQPQRLRGLMAFVDDATAQAYGLFPPADLDLHNGPEFTREEPLGVYTRRVYGTQGWNELAQLAIQAL
nr:RAMP superfamily CRISPR-associated protein [Ardenticatena sp.]